MFFNYIILFINIYILIFIIIILKFNIHDKYKKLLILKDKEIIYEESNYDINIKYLNMATLAIK